MQAVFRVAICTWIFLCRFTSIAGQSKRDSEDPPDCQPYDFEWQYTECDHTNQRWRVQVPKKHNLCKNGVPKAPVAGLPCDFTCQPGSYLDSSSDEQSCKACNAGTYSLGGGQRFEDWPELPSTFQTEVQDFRFSEMAALHFYRNYSCEKTKWKAQGKSLVSMPGLCESLLIYNVELVTEGVIRFSYEYPDTNFAVFKLEIENNQCQQGQLSRGIQLNKTADSRTQFFEMELPKGHNRLIWKSFGLSFQDGFQKPLRIKAIEIMGIAFTQECTQCPPGMYSSGGAATCELCPENTMSTRGSGECTPCDTTLYYSPEGSSECYERPPCKTTDYYESNTACNKGGTTMKKFKWLKPKICLDNVPDAAHLPEPGEPEPCPPCNPGMSKEVQGCRFCAHDEYSDGSSECVKCPGSTAPQRGLFLQWWNDLPLGVNISTECVSVFDDGCSQSSAWSYTTNKLITLSTHSDDAFHVLRIHIGGFQGRSQDIGGHKSVLGTVSFGFETHCSDDCSFFFLQDSRRKKLAGIEQWKGTHEKDEYRFDVTDTGPVTFMWVFRKTPLGQELNEPYFELKDDYARIYDISITNTLDGGASSCKPCPRGKSLMGCVPCGPLQYVNNRTLKCETCPAGMIESGSNSFGRESCVSCGEGLVPMIREKKGMCITTCKYDDHTNKRKYNFEGISQPLTVAGPTTFDNRGQGYRHVFNISLCGGSPNFNQAQCSNNISTFQGDASNVEAPICKMAILPSYSKKGVNYHSSEPQSIADTLVSISTSSPLSNVYKDTGFTPPEDEGMIDTDVFFFYKAGEKTMYCPQGRATLVILRCDPRAVAPAVEMPQYCTSGTCDGCNFIFLIRSVKACPRCDESAAQEVVGECKLGTQQVTYIMPKYCIAKGPDSFEQECQVLPFWLEVTLGCGAIVAIFLLCIILYCWKKNRKLEYTYMKLVTSSSENPDDESKLPAAETCALDEDEEQHFDAIEFSQGRRFFNKLKGLASKKDKDLFDEMKMANNIPLT